MSQPKPKKGKGPAVWDLVIADMRARDRLGRQRYGRRLRAGNGRDALQDLYEEILDAASYLKQEQLEREMRIEAAVKKVHSTLTRRIKDPKTREALSLIFAAIFAELHP